MAWALRPSLRAELPAPENLVLRELVMMIIRLGQGRLMPCSVCCLQRLSSRLLPRRFLLGGPTAAVAGVAAGATDVVLGVPLRTLQQLPLPHPAAFVRFSLALREPSTRPEEQYSVPSFPPPDNKLPLR